MLLKRSSINLRIVNNDKKTPKEEAQKNPEILHLFELPLANFRGLTNKIIIQNVNPNAIKNFLGKHFQRFNIKPNEKIFNNNTSNLQTTAANSSNSNTVNDISFLGGNDEENDENKLEKVSLDSFNIKGLIGKGSFGEVFLVEKKDTKALYALKVLKKSLIMSILF